MRYVLTVLFLLCGYYFLIFTDDDYYFLDSTTLIHKDLHRLHPY